MVCLIVNYVPSRSPLNYYEASSNSSALSPSASKVGSPMPWPCPYSISPSWLCIAMGNGVPDSSRCYPRALEPSPVLFPPSVTSNTPQEPHTSAKCAQSQAWPSSLSLTGLLFLTITSTPSHSPLGDTPSSPQLASLSFLHRHRALCFSDNTQASIQSCSIDGLLSKK